MELNKDFLNRKCEDICVSKCLDGEFVKRVDCYEGDKVKEKYIYGHPLEKKLNQQKIYEYNKMMERVELTFGSGFYKLLEIERIRASSIKRIGGFPSSNIHLDSNLLTESDINCVNYLRGPFQCDFSRSHSNDLI